MALNYKKIRYLMENETQLATIKAAYIKFRTEGYPANYVNQPARGGSVPVSLIPYCLTGSTKYITKMSGRAFGQISVLVGGEATLNIDTGAGGTAINGNKAPQKYKPPTMVIFVPKGDTAYKADSGTTQGGKTVTDDTDATPTSAVRGLKYDRRIGNSYTFPFGYAAGAASNTQLAMQGFLYIKCAKASRSVSFKPERPA